MASLTPFYPGKIFRPPLPADHLPRPDLMSAFNQAGSRRLVLVTAPAGFGKSTLAIEYCEQLDAAWHCVWIALDAQDAQPGQFMRSVVTGLRSVYPLLGDAELTLLQQSHSQQPLDIEQLMLAILAKLAEQHPADQPAVLVLDDYHLVQSPHCDRLCALLLDHLPASFQLLLTSRQRPEWHLARLRLRNQVLEVTEDQLRLSSEASADFLKQAGVAALDPQWSRQILQRNEGWIAGLRLMVVAAEHSIPAPRSFTTSRVSGPLIGEYLLEEVIYGQPDRVQSFLQDIAWLDHFTADLCDSVREAANSAEVIAHLLAHRVFLVPLDHEGKWYRFHHLFSDVLRERAMQGGGQRRRLDLHWRACQWFNAQGRLTEAVEHALAAERPDEAANLVQLLPLDQLLAEQPVSTLLRWKAELPKALQGSSERLVMVHAWTLALACQLEDAEAMLDRLQFFLPQRDAYRQRVLIGQTMCLKGFLARAAGRLEEAVHYCHQSLACLDEREAGSRLMAMLTLADIELCRQRIDSARQWTRTAVELAQRVGNLYFESQVVLMRARLMQARGQVERATRAVRGQLELIEQARPPQGLAIRGRLIVYQGYLLSLLGNRKMALVALQEGIDEARRCRDVHVLLGYCLKAGLLARQADSATEAFDTLTEAERLMHQWDVPPVYYLGWITAIKSDLWMTTGRHELAEHWLPRLRQTYSSSSPAAPPPFFHALSVVVELVYARLLWSKGDQIACESLLRDLLSRLQRTGERLQQLKVLVHLVHLLYLTHRPDAAEQALRMALSLAEEDRLAGLFMPLIQQAPAGLVEALQRASASALRDQLIEMLPSIHQPGGRLTVASLREPLSNRELDVLRCIAQGYSNQQISEALFISLHTVKSHARRINHKLGVARRTQAVAQAKVMGLLA
ncbi:hypothetical protein LCGC14_0109730 [marine sediment metagenome]